MQRNAAAPSAAYGQSFLLMLMKYEFVQIIPLVA